MFKIKSNSANFFSQNSLFTGNFEKTPVNITLIIFIIILILILIGVIIWRLFFNKKSLKSTNNKQIGSIDKEFNDFIINISAEKNIKMIYNILIKNRYSKSKYSIIPAIIFVKNKGFIISNIVKNKSDTKIIIDQRNLVIVEKGKKDITHSQVKLSWYNEISKYITKEILANVDFKKVVILKNPSLDIKNDSDFLVLNIFDLIETLENIDSKELNDKEIEKIISTLMKENIWKIKNKDLK